MAFPVPKLDWSKFVKEGYDTGEERGKVQKIGDGRGLKVYVVGKGDKCIIWNYDVHGFDGGRTRQLCDFIAEQGYMVVMPDYFRGTSAETNQETEETRNVKVFIEEESVWTGKLKDDWELSVLPFIKVKGAKTIGTIGTCWGTYINLKISEYDEVKASVSIHPSHTPVSAALRTYMGSDNEPAEYSEKEWLERVKCPQMYLPAENNHPEVKKGGLGEKVLGERLLLYEFPEMVHGFLTRGDMSGPPEWKRHRIEDGVKRAVELTVGFMNKYLQ